jgi:hypothetical protein
VAELAEPPAGSPSRDPPGRPLFFDFAVANPVCHLLTNQRTIPGFVPSGDSYAPSVRAAELGDQLLRDLGVTDPADSYILGGSAHYPGPFLSAGMECLQ